jgi:ubiquinone/menaquinone biosynthesis C-methylase UbiE
MRRDVVFFSLFSSFLFVIGTGCERHKAPEDINRLAPGYAVPRTVAPLFDPSLSKTLLDDAKREGWQKPQEIVNALHIQPTDTIADIGAGSGYMMPYFLKSITPKGHLYAEEVQESYLPMLKSKAKDHSNVTIILGTETDPKLPNKNRQDIDIFFLLTTYHEVQKPVFFLQQLKSYAKPEARLAIIDFDETIKGKRYPAPQGHSVTASAVRKEAEAAGWQYETEHDFLKDSSQFFLVFRNTP